MERIGRQVARPEILPRRQRPAQRSGLMSPCNRIAATAAIPSPDWKVCASGA